jgi:broad specificity phosphatase PhoE
MPRELYLIRHAVPLNDARSFRFSSLARDMRGVQNQSLSERGQAQARRLAPHLARLAPERIVSSTLERAAETAEILARGTGAPFETRIPELNEIAPGTLPTGMTDALARLSSMSALPRALRARAGETWYRALSTYYFAQWLRGRTRGGEAPDAVRRRMERALSKIDALPEERVAVVGHGYWIFYFVLRCLRPTIRYLVDVRPWVDNCSVTTISRREKSSYRLVRFARRHI